MRKIWILCCGVSLLFGSCIEQVETPFDAEAVQRNLVVDGTFFPGEGPYQVRLQQIADFARDSLIQIESAEVEISDGGGSSAIYRYIGDGVYQIDRGAYVGVVGKSYTLTIQWESKTYQSEAVTIPEQVPIDRIYVDFALEPIEQVPPNPIPRNVIKVLLDTSLPDRSEGPYLRWEVSEDYVLHEFLPPGSLKVPNSCYYHRSIGPQKILLLDGDRSVPGPVDGKLLGIKELDWTFFYKHYFNVVQHSISKPAFDYWQRADQVINQVGSIFDTPPAGIQGNIFRTDDPTELVLGYFEATNPDTAHHVVYKADFPFGVQVEGLCPSVFYYLFIDPTLPDPCCNCGILDWLQPGRPYYWED